MLQPFYVSETFNLFSNVIFSLVCSKIFVVSGVIFLSISGSNYGFLLQQTVELSFELFHAHAH